jgi:hypothetical protein
MLSLTDDLVSIERWLQYLEDARNRGTWRQLLKPLNRTVSSLRPKLHMLNLDIVAIRGIGYSITKHDNLIDFEARKDEIAIHE